MGTLRQTVRENLDELSFLLDETREDGGLDRDRLLSTLHLVHKSLEGLMSLVEAIDDGKET